MRAISAMLWVCVHPGKTQRHKLQKPLVGDMVYVPVGYKYERKADRIVSMENYKGKKAPYPLEKTKYIIGKVE